jgi:hypothetical protein
MNAARIGRPMRVAEEGERVMLGLRVSASTKNKLDEAARRSGRSQSQEAEMRLEMSFRTEEMANELRERDAKMLRQMQEQMNEWGLKVGVITQDEVEQADEQLSLFLKEGVMYPYKKREDSAE